MRNLILAAFTLFSVAGVTGCDDGGTKPLVLPDMAMKSMTTHDLSTGPTGCNGLSACLGACPEDSSNPGFLDPTCVQACLDASTDAAAQLYFDATIGCVAGGLCNTPPDGGGAIQCSADEISGAAQLSDPCSACVDSAYANSKAAVKSACMSKVSACLADKP